MEEKLPYTTILHQVREELGISMEEYCIADCIYHLQNNPNSKIQGWCYASKNYIGKFIRLGERTVFRGLKKLLEKKLVEKDEQTKHVRATSIWYEKVVMPKAKMEYAYQADTMTNRHTNYDKVAVGGYDKVADNNKSINNKKDIGESAATAAPTPKEKMIFFLKDQNSILADFKARGFSESFLKAEFEKFISHWTEPTASGKKQRWELEKVFDVSRRINTWLCNAQKWEKNKSVSNVLKPTNPNKYANFD